MPFYVVVRPAGGGRFAVIGHVDGRVRDVDGFVRFLTKPHGAGK